MLQLNAKELSNDDLIKINGGDKNVVYWFFYGLGYGEHWYVRQLEQNPCLI